MDRYLDTLDTFDSELSTPRQWIWSKRRLGQGFPEDSPPHHPGSSRLVCIDIDSEGCECLMTRWLGLGTMHRHHPAFRAFPFARAFQSMSSFIEVGLLKSPFALSRARC